MSHSCGLFHWVLYMLSVHLVFVTAASMWNTLLEVVHVLLCCVSLAELGLFPFNLRLIFTLSLTVREPGHKVTLRNH